MQIAFNPVLNRNNAFKGCIVTTTKIETTSKKRISDVENEKSTSKSETTNTVRISDKEDIKAVNELLPEIEELKKTKKPEDIDINHNIEGYWVLKGLGDKEVHASRIERVYDELHISTETSRQVKGDNNKQIKDGANTQKNDDYTYTWKDVKREINIGHRYGQNPEKQEAIDKLVTALDGLATAKKNALKK